MEKINVGFIGIGRIADLHFPGYRNSKKARIYAVCDTDQALCRRRRREWRAKRFYMDYQEMLADPKVDAVEILTPQKLHEKMAIDALAAGKHVALQKPMTISLDSADRILEAADSSDRVFKITENYIFYPPIVKARELIAGGAIGEVSLVRIKFISAGSGGWKVPPEAWEWRMQEKNEGRGIQTFDHGHHLCSSAWYLGGSIGRTKAWIDSLDGIIACPALITWKYSDKTAYGVIEYGYSPDMRIPSRYYANDEWMEITGSRGVIFIYRCTGLMHKGPALSLCTGKRWEHFENIKSDWAEGFKGATRNFINAIRGEEEPALTGRQGREILRFSLAIQKSARLRREVYPEEMDRAFSGLYARRRKAAERRAGKTVAGKRTWFGGKSMARYAGQAEELTEKLPGRFNADAVPGWQCTVGLRLLAEGGSPELLYTMVIKKGSAMLAKGDILPDASLVLTVPAGTWAAILLKKKRIEMAFMQGKIKIKGKAEEGLKLRSAFGI
jgi:predicted dehydrogenase